MNGDGCVSDCERKMNERGRRRMVGKRNNDWQIVRKKKLETERKGVKLKVAMK